MVCIVCGSKTSVVNSRINRRAPKVWRRRKCNSCGNIFTTDEVPVFDQAWLIIESNRKINSFSRDRLFLSLYESCKHRPKPIEDAAGLTDTVINKLQPMVENGSVQLTHLKEIILICLNRFDKIAATHYRAYHP
jgi:transcriptional regulator NrdR family protein